jgi:hypothetical protein
MTAATGTLVLAHMPHRRASPGPCAKTRNSAFAEPDSNTSRQDFDAEGVVLLGALWSFWDGERERRLAEKIARGRRAQ